jgi:mannose/fructose/N-acetylgalactosamine-specific phosphotransferase system component IIC
MAKLARASATHVAVAFLAMGAWALYANRAHGAAAILPALAQGTLSGAITFVLKRVLEWLAARLAGWRALVLPPIATASAILATLIAVHRLIGTPEIAATIAVPWSVSTLYAIVYAATLARGRLGRD